MTSRNGMATFTVPVGSAQTQPMRPHYLPGNTPGCGAFLLFVFTIVCACFTLGAIFIPSYVHVPAYYFFDMDMGLRWVHSTRNNPLYFVKKLDSFLEVFEGWLPLHIMVSRSCMWEAVAMWNVRTGCTYFEYILTASRVLVSSFYFTILAQCLSALGVLVFWFACRKLKLRAAILMLMTLSATIPFFGLIFYSVLIITNEPPQGPFFMPPFVVISYGYYFAVAAVIFNLVVPGIAVFALPAKFCVDKLDESEIDETRDIADELEEQILLLQGARAAW